MNSAIQQLRILFADEEKPAEINADGEFDNKTFNRFLFQQHIASRFKEGRQDLATIYAAMNNYKNVEEDDARTGYYRMGKTCTQCNKGAQQIVSRSVDGQCRSR